MLLGGTVSNTVGLTVGKRLVAVVDKADGWILEGKDDGTIVGIPVAIATLGADDEAYDGSQEGIKVEPSIDGMMLGK